MVSDRISALPDSLLVQILLHLPISDLVRTSVLSKRWEFLWLNVSELDLNGIDFLPYGEAFPSLMERFLEFNRRSCLQKFKIKYVHCEKRSERDFRLFQRLRMIKEHDDPVNCCCERVMEWITEVVHRGVQHLDVEKTHLTGHGEVDNKTGYKIKNKVEFMPKYMYVSKTLVSLKLVNVGLENTKFDVTLPRLKKMHLENICYKSHGLVIIEKLISGSSVLEELTMDFPVSTKQEQIDFSKNISVSREPEPKDINSLFRARIPRNRMQIVFTNVPPCLSSTLEFVKINKLIMKEETEIKLVNYLLENSAVLKKLTLSLTHSSIENQVPENYMQLLTSTMLSRTCQVVVY